MLMKTETGELFDREECVADEDESLNDDVGTDGIGLLMKVIQNQIWT
jgi:hypothetical protein